MCIIDLSRVLMFEFHCDYNKKKHGRKARLLFTDTDTLMHEIEIKDFYEDFSKEKKMFDFSSCSAKSKNYDYSMLIRSWKMRQKCCYQKKCWVKAKDVVIFGGWQ